MAKDKPVVINDDLNLNFLKFVGTIFGILNELKDEANSKCIISRETFDVNVYLLTQRFVKTKIFVQLELYLEGTAIIAVHCFCCTR